MLGVLKNSKKDVIKQDYLMAHSPIRGSHTATIQFSISHSDHVALEIYNIFGQRIASLVDAKLASGEYSIPWNTQDLAPGFYAIKCNQG